MWRQVFHLIAKVGAGSPAPGRFGSIRLWTKTGAGASRNPYMLKCAVFSGDGIALLLTPGTGVCKPVMVDGAVLTESPYASYAKGIHNEEAILHGFNSQESAPFILFDNAKLSNYESKVRAYFGDYADEVLAVKDGTIAAHGSPNKVMDAGLIRDLYGIEAQVESLMDDRMRVCIPMSSLNMRI